MTTIDKAAAIEADMYKRAGVRSKPAGDLWAVIVLNIALEYIRQDMSFTAEDLAALTDNNLHTARHAADILEHLRKYEI